MKTYRGRRVVSVKELGSPYILLVTTAKPRKRRMPRASSMGATLARYERIAMDETGQGSVPDPRAVLAAYRNRNRR